MAGITIFEPGESSSYHVHPESEEINLVLAGSGLVVSEGEEAAFGPGHAMWVPKGVYHQHRNTGYRAAQAPVGVHAAGRAPDRVGRLPSATGRVAG